MSWDSRPDDPAGSAKQAKVHGSSLQILLLTLGLVEVLLYLGLVEVPSGCCCKPCRDLLSCRLLIGLQVIHGYPDAFVVRVLGDKRVESPLSQVFDLGGRGIECHDAHLIFFARLLESGSGALPGEKVGAEDAFEVGGRSEGRGGNGRRLGGIGTARSPTPKPSSPPHQEPCQVHREYPTSGMHPPYKDHPGLTAQG